MLICKNDDWELFFAFSMMAAQMDPKDKKTSALAMEVEPVTVIDPEFLKGAYQRLDATLGTRSTISLFTRRGGTSQIDKSFWENLTRVMGSGMGEMLQAQQIQHQPTFTPSVQEGCR